MAVAWTRAAGRQALARLMHGSDVVIGAPGSLLATGAFAVPKLTVYEDDYFLDWHGRFYQGPAADTDFEVTGFDQSTDNEVAGFLTFRPVLSSAVVVTDLFEMYPDFSPAEMNDAINDAISMVEGEALEDKVDESLVVAASQWEYTVPAGFVAVEGIFQESGTANRYSSSGNFIDPRHWRILPGASPKLWFDHDLVTLTSGRQLRLVGQQAPTQLTKDADLCAVPRSFVLYQAKANLHFSRVEETGDEHYRKMVVAQARAHEERRRVRVASRGWKVA